MDTSIGEKFVDKCVVYVSKETPNIPIKPLVLVDMASFPRKKHIDVYIPSIYEGTLKRLKGKASIHCTLENRFIDVEKIWAEGYNAVALVQNVGQTQHDITFHVVDSIVPTFTITLAEEHVE
jgi:hypothetical protein